MIIKIPKLTFLVTITAVFVFIIMYINYENNALYNYKVSVEQYIFSDKNKNINIKVEYPILKSKGSFYDEEKINNILKKSVLLYTENTTKKGLNLEIQADITYMDSNIISVCYNGEGYFKGKGRVFNVLYAVNINLKDGRIITFKDIFNESFRFKLNRKIFKPREEAIDPLSTNYDIANSNVIKKMFDNYYNNKADTSFYFTKDKFVIIVRTPYGTDIYTELYAHYKEISDSILNKSLLEYF